MESIEAMRDANPEVVKCVVCGCAAVQARLVDGEGYIPICENQTCYEAVIIAINKMVVELKNEEVA